MTLYYPNQEVSDRHSHASIMPDMVFRGESWELLKIVSPNQGNMHSRGESLFLPILPLADSRKQFNRPLASFQLVQKKFADASASATLGLLGSLQLGRLKDSGQWSPDMVSIMKRNNCGEALKQSRMLMDIFGGNACSDEYPIGRHVQNLQV
jgi:alkylation response protein AidB-like acyl-CoA dehydrogenase